MWKDMKMMMMGHLSDAMAIENDEEDNKEDNHYSRYVEDMDDHSKDRAVDADKTWTKKE
jgi:hypothetical protein